MIGDIFDQGCFEFISLHKSIIPMKFSIYILTVFLSLSFVYGQEITAKEETKTLENTKYPGYSISVEGKLDRHQDGWTKLLKNKGKVRKRNSLYSIEDFVFPQITEKLLNGYTQVMLRDTTVNIWLGIDVSELEGDEPQQILGEIKGMLENYVLDYRKSLVLDDIQNAERAAAYTSQQHQRLIRDMENLKIRLLDSENEKRRLEENLKTMELEIEVLKQKIVNNGADQERTLVELEQIRKVLEMHKERLKKLN